MSTIKFSQFTTQAPVPTTYLVGYESAGSPTNVQFSFIDLQNALGVYGGTAGYVLKATGANPVWFNLFGTSNTWTASQSFQNSVAGGTFTGIVVTNTSGTSSQYADIQVQTSTYAGGIKGFYDGNASVLNALQLYSNKGITFYASSRTGSAVAGTDPTFSFVDANILTTKGVVSITTSTSNPKVVLELYNPNSGSTYIETILNVATSYTRFRGYSTYGALTFGSTNYEIIRWDTQTAYIGWEITRDIRLTRFTGSASATAISGATGTALSITNAGGVILTNNTSVNTNTQFNILSVADHSINSFSSTVLSYQLRMYVASSTSVGRYFEVLLPSNSTATASFVAERYDSFVTTTSYSFKQHYLRTSIDTSAALNPASALLHLGAAATGYASLNIKSSAGTAPSAPADGDIWYDGTNIKIRVGATTKTFTLV